MTTRYALLALLTLYLAACTTTTVAPPPPPAANADLGRFVDDLLREVPDIPGLGIAVVQNGRTVYLKNPQTGYYMGSTTKAFTGLAAAILAQRGQLDLDAPLTKYLPEVRMAAPLDVGTLTIRRLLSHTAGIANDAIVFRTAFTGEHTPSELVSLLNESKPGKAGFQYDNLGYVITSLAIERVTGRPWQQVLDDLVFTPLGMHHTSAYMSEAAKWPLAKPHMWNSKAELTVLDFMKNDQMMHAAGGTVTNPEDLAIWLQANLTKGKIGSRQLIPAAAFEEIHRMQAPVEITRGDFKSRGYGFGWYQAGYAGDEVFFHGGGFEGWQTLFSFMPQKQIGVGVMANSGFPSQRVLQLVSNYVYDRLLEKENVDAAQRIAALKADVAKRRESVIADSEKRARRPWMLQRANDAYTGRYENPQYGTIAVEQRGDKLVATLGRLSGVLEAFTEPESARVELVPGSGEVLRFTFNNGSKAVTMKWGDEVFRRVE